MNRFTKFLCLFFLAAVLTGCSGKTQDPPVPDPMETQTIVEAPPETAQPSEEPRLPENSLLFGADLSGLTGDEAIVRAAEALEAYILKLSVDGAQLTFSAGELDLTCDDADLRAYLDSLQKGRTGATPPQVRYDLSGVTRALHTELDQGVRNACIVYDGSSAAFVIRGEAAGRVLIPESVVPAIEEAVSRLQSEVQATAQFKAVEPSLTGNDQAVKDALEKANSLLETDLRYTYTPVGGQTAEEVLDRTVIASLLTVKGDGLTTAVSKDALNRYVAQMDGRHGIPAVMGKFKTTGGLCLDNVDVSYGGQSIDRGALYSDLEYCITNRVSGIRIAPYRAKTAGSEMAFGGSYVEVDLNTQHIWAYKDGVCVVSSPIVSGNVAGNNMTPTGVYSIQKKATDAWLVGPTWRDWVYYWMPFYGSYGLHDADGWRTEYGGDIYLQNGSHGCVNLPYSAARDIYENVSVGTKVILYGGARSLDLVEQSLTGTVCYAVDADSAPFALDTEAKYPGCAMSYTSSDESVAVVDASGVVSVVGEGSCTITVQAAPNGQYTGAALDVTVTVSFLCDRSGHRFDPESPECLNGCGTKNPDHPPVEEPAQPEEPEEPSQPEDPTESAQPET